MKTALIFGVTGQDGSYLAEKLCKDGYNVVGVKRRSSSINTVRLTSLIDKGYDSFELVHGDITDTASVFSIIGRFKPDEIYNLAAQSHVGVSFNEPEYTSQVDGIGTLRLLEACKEIVPESKFYQASTSELFGGLESGFLSEMTPFNPRSPYAAAKLYAYYLVKQYREGYGLKAYNGILFNHESPRRGENFVSRKITRGIGALIKRNSECIELGNLDAVRDWGHALDYVSAMNIMMNFAPPDDYVVATGQCHTVREFCIAAFKEVGHLIKFDGVGIAESAVVVDYIESNLTTAKIPLGTQVIKVSDRYFRPLEVPHLLGDSSKFRSNTGWSPKYSFQELVADMVKQDVECI